MPVRAFLEIGALALILSQAPPQMAPAQVVESHDYVIAQCPSSDIPSGAQLRRGMASSLDQAIEDPSMFSYNMEYIRRVELPQLLIVSDRIEQLGLLWDKRVIENSADLNTAFHLALSTQNASLMRSVATSNVRRTRTQRPFLAPTAELPALAALYVKLFERSRDLSTEYRKLAANTLAEAKRLGPAPVRMRDERPEDARRLATAWMLFHLERIRLQSQTPGNARAAPEIFLDRAAALVSRECQPQTWWMIEAIRSGKAACSDRANKEHLPKFEHPYLCKLIEPMEQYSGR